MEYLQEVHHKSTYSQDLEKQILYIANLAVEELKMCGVRNCSRVNIDVDVNNLESRFYIELKGGNNYGSSKEN